MKVCAAMLIGLLLSGCGPGSVTGICLFDPQGHFILPVDCRTLEASK